jgi:hypothetical protein
VRTSDRDRSRGDGAEPGPRRKIHFLDLVGIVLLVAFLGISLVRSLFDSDGHMARQTMDKFRRLATHNGPSAFVNAVPALSFTEEATKAEPALVCEDVKPRCCVAEAAERASVEPPAAEAVDCLEARKRCCPEIVADGPRAERPSAAPVAKP